MLNRNFDRRVCVDEVRFVPVLCEFWIEVCEAEIDERTRSKWYYSISENLILDLVKESTMMVRCKLVAAKVNRVLANDVAKLPQICVPRDDLGVACRCHSHDLFDTTMPRFIRQSGNRKSRPKQFCNATSEFTLGGQDRRTMLESSIVNRGGARYQCGSPGRPFACCLRIGPSSGSFDTEFGVSLTFQDTQNFPNSPP